MSHDPHRPQVFLSFAGNDRPEATRLREELCRRGVGTFLDEQSIKPGGDLVLTIDRALTESDYYVLLWSKHAQNRPWVQAEWSSAFCRDLEQERAFLFVVRLDDTPLPRLLTTRKYLDVNGNWPRVIDALVSVWRQDLDQGTTVLPAPVRSTVDSGIELYVRNQALQVTHVIVVPKDATGGELGTFVRARLELPVCETKFGGTVGMRFFYRLNHRDEPIPDLPIVELGIADGSTIDLEVELEPFAPGGTYPRRTFRDDRELSGMSPAMARSLIKAAFGHLLPRRKSGRGRKSGGILRTRPAT